MLQRSPNREWAGDMPRIRKTDASRRTMREFMDGDGVKRALKAKGVSKTAARKALAEELEAQGLDAVSYTHLDVYKRQDLDDGVPYSINCLAENVRIIHAQLVEQGHGDQARSVLKLADHIDLEKTRASRDIEQRQIMRDFRKAIGSVKDERVEAQRERAELEREFDERLDKTRMEYIAILGVFAAVVLAFNGGVGFSTSTMGAVGVGSGMRALVFLTALVGFVLINTVCILLVFIWKMSFNHRKVELGKWPRNCLIVADVGLLVIMAATALLGHPCIRAFIGL